MTLAETLAALHLFLSSTNAIVAFSLLVYVLTRPRSQITLPFAVVITLVAAMWVGDAGHISVRSDDAIHASSFEFWLRVQSIGLALLPAAYLHISDTFLRTTGSLSAARRALVAVAYGVGLVCLGLLLFGGAVIAGPAEAPWGMHYAAGPLYPVFAAYSIVLTLLSLWNFIQARRRCLTASLRRRMGYVSVLFSVPALGSVAYLLATYLLGAYRSGALPAEILTLFPIAGSVGVTPMVALLAYVVSYQGVLLPDRVVKQSLIMYLLRGPLLGVVVTFLIIAIPRAGRILAITTDRFQIFAVVVAIVVLQAGLDLVRPWISRLVQQDEEIAWLEEINERLLTSADLSELLHNTLTAVCEVLRVPSGLIVAPDRQPGDPVIRARVGPETRAQAFMDKVDIKALAQTASAAAQSGQNGHVLEHDSYWIFPLSARDGPTVIGFLAAEKPAQREGLSEDEKEIVQALVQQAGVAVEDVQLQRTILAALQGVAPEIEQVQLWGSQLRQSSPQTLAQMDSGQPVDAEFQRSVRDALAHYWGGPKLTGNPLLNLEVVRGALQANNNVPSQALRSVLRQSVDALRPSTEQDLVANEWILYNILRLRFLEGKRVKEIAQELAMSESDFYRKERAAIREVAHLLALMEREKVDSQRQ